MDQFTPSALEDSELTDEILAGAVVYGPDNAEVGTISHLHVVGIISEVIVRVAGREGTSEKEVAVLLRDVSFMRGGDEKVVGQTESTREDLFQRTEHTGG